MSGETKEASLVAVVARVAERRQQWLVDEGISVPREFVDGGVKRVLKYLEEWKDITSDTKVKLEQIWSESDQEGTDAIVALIRQGVDVKAPNRGGTITLHYAAGNGNIEVLSLLLEGGADVSAKTKDGNTALHWAAGNGHVEVLSLLLERGADVSAQDKDGWTALHLAASNGHVEVLSLLLERGADVAAQAKNGSTTLHEAIRTRYMEELSFSLKGGADVAARKKGGWTALHLAARNGHVEVLSLLLERGADVAAQDKDGRTALHLAARNGHVEVLSLLLEGGADVSAQAEDGRTALHLAVLIRHVEVLSLLLERGADVSAQAENGNTALHLAVLIRHVEVLSLLLEGGADVSAQDKDGWTALHLAASNGYVEVLSLLLERGADVAARKKDGRTALHLAARNGKCEVLSLLLGGGADVAAQDKDGWTALDLAARYDHVEVLSLLLEGGADVSAQDKDGNTALHLAADSGHVEVLSLLLEGGADVSAQDKDGNTALHWAAGNGHVEVLSLLLERGADVSAQDKDGWTALHLAASNGHVEVLSLLSERGADVAAQAENGLTALHCAATSGSIQAVSLLLGRNADANAITKEGHNPLTFMILVKRDDPDDSYLAVAHLLSSLEPTLDLSPLIGSSTLEMHQLGMLTCAQYWQGRQKNKLPLLNVPSEVVAGGEDAVKTYLTEVEKTTTGIYRRKVCVVGPSTWGKTSLIKSITSKGVSLEKEDERTIGIDLFSMEFEETSDDNEGMKQHYVTFWDFAGQDIYQLAHALFFSERTLYLLCLDMEKYTEDLGAGTDSDTKHLRAGTDSDSMRIFFERNVIHWIHIILIRQPKARFKLIGTKCDTVSKEALRCVQLDVKIRLESFLRDTDPLVKVDNAIELGDEFDQNFVVTSATSTEALLRARESIETVIREQSELSFRMPQSYSAVLQYIIDIRRSMAKATPKERVQKLVVKQFDFFVGVLKNVECLDNSPKLCTEILQTLHRLGDILWWKQEDDFQDWIILDPAIMLDLVRDVISHTHEFQKGGQYATLCQKGRLEHTLLKSFEWWEALDTELMTMFKLLLKKCCLAYPVDNGNVAIADLIVPTYWKAKEKAKNPKKSLETRRSVLDQHYIDGAGSAKWRYSLPVGISEAIYLNFAVQCYDRQDVARTVGPTFLESYIDGELACGIYFASGSRCDTITIEVFASTNDIAWTELSYWVIAMEQVLLDYPGLDQPNHKRIGRCVVSPDNTEHCVNFFLANERNLDEGRLRETYHWLPPNFEWFLQSAWKIRGKLAELRTVHQLIVLKRLIVNQDKRRLPAVWTLSYDEKSSTIELRVHSDLSGKCFHDPLEIRVPGSFETFLGEHKGFFQAGVSILSLASIAIPFAVASTAAGMALSAVEGAVSGASSNIKSILDKMGLTPGKTRKFDKEEHKNFLRKVLNHHGPPLDEFKIGPESELCCAATENGSYVWVHPSEVAALSNRFKECTCISMCFINVVGLKPTKKGSIYYEWKLVRSNKVIQENTIQIEANTSTGEWKTSRSVPLEEVDSVQELRQCKLEITVKRQRQACWPRKDQELGNGCHAFGDFKIGGFSGSNTMKIPISRRNRDICSVECQITVVSTNRGL